MYTKILSAIGFGSLFYGSINRIYSHTICSDYRDSNEDKICIKSGKINFYGLYDGHNGYKISKFLQKNASDHFQNLNLPIKNEIVEQKFNKIQSDIIEKDSYRAFTSGSTCLIVLEDEKFIQTFNAGDCRALLSKNNQLIQLTTDHTCNNKDEQERISNIDDYKKLVIYEDDDGSKRIGNLEPTRGFGDTDTYPYITCNPEINTYKKDGSEEFMVMASDGLWDVLSNNEVATFIKNNYNDKQIAKKIIDHAVDKGSDDDISTIIVKFKNSIN